MTDNLAREASVYALIEENPQAADATTRAFASSRKATTCSRVMVGNPPKKSSIDSPPSR